MVLPSNRSRTLDFVDLAPYLPLASFALQSLSFSLPSPQSGASRFMTTMWLFRSLKNESLRSSAISF